MADPRLRISFMNVTGPEATFQTDTTIDLPVFSNGQNLSVSKSLSSAVTCTSTSTYASPNDDSITVGYGVAGNRVLGQVLTVAPEGYATVQLRGFAYFSVNQSNPPVVNGLCAVDGNGNVQAASAAANANAVCLGFVYNHSQEAFTHLSGNLSVPTSTAQGPEVALVLLS